MPVVPLNRYTCPITGTVEYSPEIPKGWFVIEGEVFAPNASLPLAEYIRAHPEVGFTELLANLAQHPQQTAAAVMRADSD